MHVTTAGLPRDIGYLRTPPEEWNCTIFYDEGSYDIYSTLFILGFRNIMMFPSGLWRYKQTTSMASITSGGHCLVHRMIYWNSWSSMNTYARQEIVSSQYEAPYCINRAIL